MSVPSLICMVLGGLLAILCRFLAFFLPSDSVMCVALLANTIKCKKRCHESLKTIQHLVWKGPQIIKNETSRRFGGALGTLGFMNAERRADKDGRWTHFGATWLILCAILAPTEVRRVKTLDIS